MTTGPEQIPALLQRYLDNEASEEEVKDLLGLLRSYPQNATFENYIISLKERLPEAELPGENWNRIWDQIRSGTGQAEKTKLRKLRFLRWTAAAALIILAGAATYTFFLSKKDQPSVTHTRQPVKPDLPPGSNAAVLTLSGGRQIVLDSTAKGAIGIQGNTSLVNTGGQLLYNAPDKKDIQVMYNTLSTRRANQYQLVLPDGSRVWLNAASSITYPTSFNGSSRTVSITGEAYFEIAKNPGQPFIVEAAGAEVEVLGTHFNVMAYTDEAELRTTLLEGSVRFTSTTGQKILIPGEQIARSNSAGTLRIVAVDTSAAVAWVHGQLTMKYMDLAAFMRQVSRWYDVDIVYEGKLPDLSFSGALDRKVNLSYVLSALQDNGIHCTLEGKTLKISAQ